jgi:hypothetical protein
VLVILHVAAWPASIVPLHPLENVAVRGAITETLSLAKFVTYISPLFGLNAIPNGFVPTGIVATTTPAIVVFSVVSYVTGNGGVNVKDVPLSEPLKEVEDPLLVDTVILN